MSKKKAAIITVSTVVAIVLIAVITILANR